MKSSVMTMVKAELEQTADPARRQLFVDTWERIPKRPCRRKADFMVRRSDMTKSLYGDGSHTGISLKQALTTGRGRFVDAIIAVTAAGEADVLATTDPVLPKRIAASQVACTVWGPDELKAFLAQATHSEEPSFSQRKREGDSIMTRVALYARYSSENQKESSITDQFRNCEQRAAREGWASRRGTRTRPSAGPPPSARLPTDARGRQGGAFDVLLVDDFSRLSRDSMESEQARRRLIHWGVRLIGVSDGIDTAAKGHKMLTSFKGIMNEVFLDDLRDRVLRGMTGQVLKGYHGGGPQLWVPAPAGAGSQSNGPVWAARPGRHPAGHRPGPRRDSALDFRAVCRRGEPDEDRGGAEPPRRAAARCGLQAHDRDAAVLVR